MISLQKLFQKYSGALRGWKVVYFINNLLNKGKLSHNRELYKKYGVDKSIYQSIGSEDFKIKSEDVPWLDRPNAKEHLMAHAQFSSFSLAMQKKILQFEEEGYLILENFFEDESVEKCNEEVERLRRENKADFNYTGRKMMELYKDSEFIDRYFFRNEGLLQLLNFLMGKPVLPFHTINFIEGSEQKAHSDSIHMTTEPEGYLIAAWIALEDTHENNGPLFYYPKSHRLPYLMNRDYDSGHTKLKLGKDAYRNYETKIEEVIKDHGFEKKYFHAKKGDVLVWHANLLHGGAGIKTKGLTRKSMVSHYFCEGVICYHEISQRPALIQKIGK